MQVCIVSECRPREKPFRKVIYWKTFLRVESFGGDRIKSESAQQRRGIALFARCKVGLLAKFKTKIKMTLNYVYWDSKGMKEEVVTSYKATLHNTVKATDSFSTISDAKTVVENTSLADRTTNRPILLLSGEGRHELRKGESSSFYPAVEKMAEKFQGEYWQFHIR